MERWSVPVDLYCERTDPSFWSEPVNALTNAAFLIAAAAAFRVWRGQARDWPSLALIAVTALVGIGSFLFHSVATRSAALFNTIPIAIFIYGYLLLSLRRFLRLGIVASLAILAGFAAGSHGLGWMAPRGFLNGSYTYLPALVALLAIGLLAPAASTRRTLLWVAAVFTLSVTFRSIDILICDAFALGTHFLWHSLNGVVLYLLLMTAIRDAPKAMAAKA